MYMYYLYYIITCIIPVLYYLHITCIILLKCCYILPVLYYLHITCIILLTYYLYYITYISPVLYYLHITCIILFTYYLYYITYILPVLYYSHITWSSNTHILSILSKSALRLSHGV